MRITESQLRKVIREVISEQKRSSRLDESFMESPTMRILFALGIALGGLARKGNRVVVDTPSAQEACLVVADNMSQEQATEEIEKMSLEHGISIPAHDASAAIFDCAGNDFSSDMSEPSIDDDYMSMPESPTIPESRSRRRRRV